VIPVRQSARCSECGTVVTVQVDINSTPKWRRARIDEAMAAHRKSCAPEDGEQT